MFAILIYGEFRTFETNLKENIRELFGELNKPVHFYILTEDCQDYEIKKNKVIGIIEDSGYEVNGRYEVKYFENMKTCKDYDINFENEIYNDYYHIPYDKVRDDFTPKLFYRRCLINKIMNNFGIKYDKVFFVRLFDVIFKRAKSLDFFNNIHDNKIYYSVDTFFISTQENINIFFNFNFISNIIHLDNMYEFQKFYLENDYNLGKFVPKIALETIYNSILYNNFYNNCKNLRYDFTRNNLDSIWNNYLKDNTIRNDIIDFIVPFIKDDYLFVLHCPKRRL